FRTQEATGAAAVRFSVPTGNFGDIFAGYVAYRMGLPVDRLVLATNENDILTRYFNTGVYSLGEVAPTLSPSMDIQVASNFERYLYCLTGGNAAVLREWMDAFKAEGTLRPGLPPDPVIVAGRGDTEMTLTTIRSFWENYGYLLDPHTAVGVAVGERFTHPEIPLICLATAHPAKFGEAILRATGQDLAHHPILDALAALPTRVRAVPADADAVAKIVASAVRGD
ncbi:MAG: threonine synthase, partial [Kiritimatiellia bacterium]|nr:threonine synthase [Kiritimatiellia bacterium]